LRSISIWLCCPLTSDPRSMCCLIFNASSTTVLFQICLGLPLLTPFWFQSNACFFNGFIPLPHGMTHQSPFPLSNSYYYRLLSGISHSSVLLFILGYLMPIILRKHRFTNICNLFAICIIIFHAPHPYNSTELTRILNIRILVSISVFLFSHNVCSSTKIPFALLIRALAYWSAPPSAVQRYPHMLPVRLVQ